MNGFGFSEVACVRDRALYRVALLLLATFLAIDHACAQTCASPLALPLPWTTGNTCNSTNQLPYLANGAVAAAGAQDIYHGVAVNAQSVSIQVQPDAGIDLALFICPNQCSTYATCIAAVDDGGAGVAETAALPDGPGDYYIIVGATGSGCGGYTLSVIAPLGAVR